MNMWIQLHIERALDHFGRLTEPKRVMADSAWYKSTSYNGWDNTPRYNHFFTNDLLGQRIPITEQQYDDQNYTTPN